MDKENFIEWLSEKYEESTVKSRIANCERIIEYEGELDTQFDTDKGEYLIKRLTYTKKDEKMGIEKKHNIPIAGDVYNGTAAYKQAAKLYFSYRSGELPEKKESVKNVKSRKNKIKKIWPVWETPTIDEIYNIVKISTKYIKFLNPEIVKKIVEDNRENIKKWSEILIDEEVDPEIYLWNQSPCAFPGIRRHAGSKEISFFKKHTEIDKIEDAIKLDDNDFPKHIWSFIFLGKKFPKKGPEGYSLAHLADHKEYSNRLFDEFKIKDNKRSKKMFGLFTAPTNTVYIPSVLLRPTDFSPEVRRVLIERAEELYGEFCNILPPWAKLKNNKEDLWKSKNFEWGEPVGEEKDVEDFLSFRKTLIENRYEK